MTTENNNNGFKQLYVYEIPYMERKQLCRILDLNDDWKELGGKHMGYRVFDIQEIENQARRSSCSPTELLLECWGQQNHSVLELFVLLARICHKPALSCITSLVEPQYHKLIDPSDSQMNSRNGNTTSTDRLPSTGGNTNTTSNNVPLHVKYIEEGKKVETSSKILNGPPFESTRTSNETRSSPSSGGSMSRVAENAGALLMIPFPELVTATQNWHKDNVLGKGGFGEVFKGDWKHTAVAIKLLKNSTKEGGGVKAESLRELKYLNACRHDNVLPLYGYSIGAKGEACLVYQLMAGGSLEERLKCKDGQPPLPWKQRLRVAQGVAKGLQFLHTVSRVPLIHGDIKSANILLDVCGEPRIGDFGLAREGPNSDQDTHMRVTRVHGTEPYLPMEFLRGHQLSTKVDTYSFGVVLFELVTGLRVFDNKRKRRFLKDHVVEYCKIYPTELGGLQDARLLNVNEHNPNLCKMLIFLGIKCVQNKASDRPDMVKVWQELMAMPGGEDCREII